MLPNIDSASIYLSLEYFLKPAGLLTVGYFEKTIEDYILITEVGMVGSGPNSELFLLGTQNRVFERLCGREPQSGTRRDLDGLTRGGVTAHACLGLAFAKDSESRQTQGPFLLELSHYEAGQLLERALRLLLGHTDLVGEMGCDLRLRHHPPPYEGPAARARCQRDELIGVFQVRKAQISAYFLGMVRVFEQAVPFSTRGRAIL